MALVSGSTIVLEDGVIIPIRLAATIAPPMSLQWTQCSRAGRLAKDRLAHQPGGEASALVMRPISRNHVPKRFGPSRTLGTHLVDEHAGRDGFGPVIPSGVEGSHRDVRYGIGLR